MTSKNALGLYEPCKFDLGELITKKEGLAYLVGAGISINPPSDLMSARQIMESIVRFSAVEDAVDKILDIEDLRFEYLVQEFRDQYDKQLRIMNYFEQSTQPNIIHKFLAQQLADGHVVLTTNFDSLIERAVGLKNDALRVIITRQDFEKYSNPKENIEKGVLAVYKLHGSLKNPKTGEDTQESVITTLDSLGKYKEGEVFTVETSKRDLFERIGHNRSLIVMGYSGGDDFDIVPTLLHIQGLKRVIWISHSDRVDSMPTAYRFRSNTKTITANLVREDRLLCDIKNSGVPEVIKIVVNTAVLISEITGETVYKNADTSSKYNAFEWLINNFLAPDEYYSNTFTAKVLNNYRHYNDALVYFQRALEAAKSRLDKQPKMAGTLNDIGLIYFRTGQSKEALNTFHQALEINEKIGNFRGMTDQLGNMGVLYRDTNDPEKALEYFQKAYDLYKESKDILGMASQLGNIGVIYSDRYDFQKAMHYAQESYKNYEIIGNLKGMADQLGNIGALYQFSNNLSKALDYFKQSLEIYKRLGDLQGIAVGLGNVGAIYALTHKTKTAIQHFQESYTISKRIGYLKGIADQSGNMGVFYKGQGEFKKALEFFKEAYEIHEQSRNSFGMAMDLGHIGTIYRDQRDFKAALDHLQRAYTLFKQIGAQREMKIVLRDLERVEAMGSMRGRTKLRQSLEDPRHFSDKITSINNENTRSQSERLRVPVNLPDRIQRGQTVLKGKSKLQRQPQEQTDSQSRSRESSRKIGQSVLKHQQLFTRPTRPRMGVPRPPIKKPEGKIVRSVSDIKRGDESQKDPSCVFSLRHLDSINDSSWSPESTKIATGSGKALVHKDKSLRIWDLKRGQEICLSNHTAEVSACAWSPDGSLIAYAYSLTLRIINAETQEEVLKTPSNHRAIIHALQWSPDNRRVLSSSRDGTLKIWDLETVTELKTLSEAPIKIDTGSWSPNGKYIVYDYSNRLIFINGETYEKEFTIDTGRRQIKNVSWS
ncbi:MAG: tetratricopeptide repeat protein, partial [Candidatus Hodarchaeota archaeon]